MKKILFLPIACFLLISSCAVKSQKSVQVLDNVYITSCPLEGECKLEILNDKSIKLLKQEDGSYVKKITTDFSKNVFVITYTNPGKEGVMDMAFEEKVYFEVAKSRKEWSLKESAMYRSQLIYERNCRCPEDQRGLDYVLEGKFDYRRMRSLLDVDIKIKNPSLPLTMRRITLKGDVLETF